MGFDEMFGAMLLASFDTDRSGTVQRWKVTPRNRETLAAILPFGLPGREFGWLDDTSYTNSEARWQPPVATRA
jgi:hypothetical protein